MYFIARGAVFNKLRITEDMIRLPEETHGIWVDFTRYEESSDFDEVFLFQLLRNSNMRIKEADVGDIGAEFGLSPVRVELLKVILERTESLRINRWQSDLAFSCLANCLSQPNGGLRELRFSFVFRQTLISINQAQILFEGVASSSCLKILHMQQALFEPDDEMEANYESYCNILVDALQRNRSLKKLYLDTTPFLHDRGIFPRIFKAVILDTKVLTLCLSAEREHHETFKLSSNLLIETLCNNECKVKYLSFSDCAVVQSPDDDDQMHDDACCNKSLRTLQFSSTKNLDPTTMVEVARRFRSLTSLEMPQSDTSDLSLWDSLLIGDDEQRLSLQCLDIVDGDIDEHQAIEFFRKLPQMKCIREVYLPENPFESSAAWVPVLVDAIQHNKSVEIIEIDFRHVPMPEEEMAKACSKIDDALRRNKERRLAIEYLALARSKILPEKLWPLVLERAQKPLSLSLFKTYNGHPKKQHSLSAVQKDLVNRLLKEKMLQDQLC